MRIIAGKYKGREVCAPKGRDVRPTTDRVREALFSSLISQYGSLEGAVVLDAFAGSGALGLEALSRGAVFAYFCEQNKNTAYNLKCNIRDLDIDPGNFMILQGDVFLRLFGNICADNSKGKINVVFLDPPYAMDSGKVAHLVERLDEQRTLSEDCVVVYEHSSKQENLLELDNFELKKSKKYGNIQADFYKKEQR